MASGEFPRKLLRSFGDEASHVAGGKEFAVGIESNTR